MFIRRHILLLTAGILGLQPRLTAEYMVGFSSELAASNRPLHFAVGTSLIQLVRPRSSADSLPPEANYQWYQNGVQLIESAKPLPAQCDAQPSRL